MASGRRMSMGEMNGEEREEWWRRGKMKKIDLRIAL